VPLTSWDPIPLVTDFVVPDDHETTDDEHIDLLGPASLAAGVGIVGAEAPPATRSSGAKAAAAKLSTEPAKSTKPAASAPAKSTKPAASGPAKSTKLATSAPAKSTKPAASARAKSTSRSTGGGGGGGRGKGIALDPLPEFVSLLGVSLQVGKPCFVLAEQSTLPIVNLRAYDSSHDAAASCRFSAVKNVRWCLSPRDFYTDEASCTMDALNLAVGRVRIESAL
jgi:hypothetical protein